jgi:hypothetical protein
MGAKVNHTSHLEVDVLELGVCLQLLVVHDTAARRVSVTRCAPVRTLHLPYRSCVPKKMTMKLVLSLGSSIYHTRTRVNGANAAAVPENGQTCAGQGGYPRILALHAHAHARAVSRLSAQHHSTACMSPHEPDTLANGEGVGHDRATGDGKQRRCCARVLVAMALGEDDGGGVVPGIIEWKDLDKQVRLCSCAGCGVC